MNSKPKILVVDDVSSNIHLLMNILKDKYTIVAATSAQKALELASTHPLPDMILTDVLMPDMNGYELCKALKNNRTTQHIPVLFVTSLSNIQEQEEGLVAGGMDFITKPFSKEIVLHKVKIHMPKIEKKNIHHEIRIVKEDIDMDEKKSILVVDDSVENIQVMIEILKEQHSVSVATSGKKALEQLENGLNPDLILLDVIMPEMDGYELCETILSKPEYEHIPIIFVTVLEKEKDIVKGLELGAVDYVVKPIEPVVLNARINTHLKLKRYQDKLVHDIEEKDELLVNQSKMVIVGEMFNFITHQWKQPMSTINVAVGGIKIEQEFGTLDDEKLMRGLDTVEESVKYLNQTVEDFKNFLVNERKKRRFNVKLMVHKTLKLLDSKFKSSAITIQNDVEDIEILNYQNDFIQVLMNIFSNAQEALESISGERKIEISSQRTDDDIIISICDNAGGIPLDIIDNVFDKYFTTKEYKEGSGLGMFMSKKITDERLHGTLQASNSNEGACFEITMPLHMH